MRHRQHRQDRAHPHDDDRQELIDRQKAKDQGAITEADYERTKSEIMKQANWSEFADSNRDR